MVSFDIFDTLVIRNVSRPKDVFKIVEQAFNVNSTEEYFPFAEERIKAEKECRRCSQFEEVTFDEIYAYININEEKKKRLKQLEIEVEHIVCNVNPYFYNVYKKYLALGYKIILISDMYFSSEILKSILKKCGYTEYASLFVSSEARKMKHSSNLYSYVVETLGIQEKDLVHFGNNFKVDYLAPKKIGVRSKWYKTHIPVKEYSNYADNFVNRMRYYDVSDETIRHDIGYRIMGPIGVGFCSWIHQYCQKLNKEKIVFLSRDGYVFSEIYKKLFPEKNVSYLRVSRRALRNASMLDIDSFEEFTKTIPPFKEYSVDMLLDILEIDISSSIYKMCQEKLDFELSQKFPTEEFLNNAQIAKVYEWVKKEKSGEWAQQKEYLKRYLQQEGFCGNVAIVDLSFKGTAFGLLAKFCQNNKIDINMDAFVFGKTEDAAKRIGAYANKIHGWVFEEMKNNPIANILLSNATLYERFFFDNSGTTLEYNEENSQVVPVLDNNNREEANLSVIAEVRNGIDDFTNQINDFIKITGQEITKSCSIKYLIEFLLYPFNEHVCQIGNMVEDNVVVRYIAKPKSRKYYLLHLSDFLKDMKDSFWKQAFLYRVFHLKSVVYLYNIFYLKAKGVSISQFFKMRKWLKG